MALDRFFRRRRPQQQVGAELPDLWTQCPQCKEGLYNRDLELGSFVCAKCGHHLRLDAGRRLDFLVREGARVDPRRCSGECAPLGRPAPG